MYLLDSWMKCQVNYLKSPIKNKSPNQIDFGIMNAMDFYSSRWWLWGYGRSSWPMKNKQFFLSSAGSSSQWWKGLWKWWQSQCPLIPSNEMAIEMKIPRNMLGLLLFVLGEEPCRWNWGHFFRLGPFKTIPFKQ